MVSLRLTVLIRLALVLAVLPLVLAFPHGGHVETPSNMTASEHHGMDMSSTSAEYSEGMKMPNYFRHPGMSGWMYGHILSMILSWALLLPLSVMFSISDSRYTILTQSLFFATNALGLFLGTVYNSNTPDLYPNNAHHKMGWIFTWIALTWVLIGIVKTYMAKARNGRLSVSEANMAKYEQLQQAEDELHAPRFSRDSGQGTERNSTSLFGSGTPVTESEPHDFEDHLEPYTRAVEEPESGAEKRGFLRNTRLDTFLSRNVQKLGFGKPVTVLRIIYSVIDRTIIIMAFLAFTSGGVTYGGIFRGSEVFSGLAHFIKGGIFFWLGILMIGRWAGSFADLGWAWNVKPPASIVGRWKAATPTAEFVESFLICLYGISNVWLEHLAAWGGEWSAMDLEHVAITVLFFGGGLLGMFIESPRIRNFLNNALENQQSEVQYHSETGHEDASPTNPTFKPPVHATTPLNPMPALTILLLGIIMSAHHQHSQLARDMHTYWGNLFAFAAAARMGTYVLNYLRPPVSYLPSRPPTEILAGFCLTAGGFLFMISPRDIVDALELNGWDGMVAFTVGMGFTAIVCAGVVGLCAAKGWAIAKEKKSQFPAMTTVSAA